MRFLAAAVVVCTTAAQAPVVGDINFYGLRRVSAEHILNALKLKSGNPLPPSKGDMQEAIEDISGVVAARVEAVCCDGPQAILFIGIEEKGAPHASFRSEPSGEATLPQDLIDTYQKFLVTVQHAASRGNTFENLTAGHPLMADPDGRALQEQFISFAAEHREQLHKVLRDGSEPDQRAIAAAVLDYAPNKKEILDDLQYALQDPDESVRANAVRSLTAIAVLASKRPDLGIHIAATWFVEMLNSVVLSDRVEAVKALLTLTDGGDQAAPQQIRERGLASLIEMARWKTARYALPPFVLLGRVAGIPETEIHQRWEKGDRDSLIDQAQGNRKRGG